MSASTSAGEGPPSNRITLTPKHSPTHPPLTLGGGREWWVTINGGVTLGCRRIGVPSPSVEWKRYTLDRNGVRKSGVKIGPTSSKEQLLPGGDLHVSGN